MLEEIFPNQDAQKFYSQLAEIANMAKSPYANFFVEQILGATAAWAHEHRDAIERLQRKAADQGPVAEPDGALDPAPQAEQKPCANDPCDNEAAAPASDCAANPDCSSAV